jgi:hypothetical protein
MRAGEGASQQEGGDIGASDEEHGRRREAEQRSNRREAIRHFRCHTRVGKDADFAEDGVLANGGLRLTGRNVGAQTSQDAEASATAIDPWQGFLLQGDPEVDGTVAIYPFQPVRRNAPDESIDAIDANLLATNVGLRAEFALPHAVADDNPSVQ